MGKWGTVPLGISGEQWGIGPRVAGAVGEGAVGLDEGSRGHSLLHFLACPGHPSK